MQEDINGAIKSTIAQEMVIGWVVNLDIEEGKLGSEMAEERNSWVVLWVDIGVASNEDLEVVILVEQIIKAGVKRSKSRHKFNFFASSWEVYCKVSRGAISRIVEKNCCNG